MKIVGMLKTVMWLAANECCLSYDTRVSFTMKEMALRRSR
jgi:hypothetical protein